LAPIDKSAFIPLLAQGGCVRADFPRCTCGPAWQVSKDITTAKNKLYDRVANNHDGFTRLKITWT
jgi:hypothetical protein